MQKFLQFITWRLFTAQHVSGVPTPIIRSSTTAVAASGFTYGAWWYQCCWSCSGRPAGPTTTNSTAYHHAPNVKPEAATAVVELLIMGVRTPETCWAVNKIQVINWRNFCIYLVDLCELYDDTRICNFFTSWSYVDGLFLWVKYCSST